MTFTCWLISSALRQTEAGSGLDCRALSERFGVTAGGARQNPFQRWNNADGTRDMTFDPGTLAPGAQSQGMREPGVPSQGQFGGDSHETFRERNQNDRRKRGRWQ